MRCLKNITMATNSKKLKLITHDGSFHADDIFASATLSLMLEDAGKNFEIIRTREEEIIKSGDYVYDVGGIYDPKANKFDHHQHGGAGMRENGIEYSSFGLIWRQFGEEICGDKEASDELDRKIVAPIDAVDNGMDIVASKYKNIFPYNADQVFLAYSPTWKEVGVDINKIFFEQVEKAKEILKREIKVARDDAEGRRIILESYENSKDKRIIELSISFPRYLFQKTLSKFPEPLYAVYPGVVGKNWKVEAISKTPDTFESRKLFPESWRGFLNNDPRLKELTGVEEALFSHRAGFLITLSSKEGAIKLAQIAVES